MTVVNKNEERGLFNAAIGDGRQLLLAAGFLVSLAGVSVIFQALTGHLLPHDEAYLGMTVEALRTYADGRIVDFMVHDRIAFGGALLGLGVLYMWLAEFPLRAGRQWSWWAYASSSVAGICSFLSFLSYGYLDTWHGLATSTMLPLIASGLWLTRPKLPPFSLRDWDAAQWSFRQNRNIAIGNACLTLTALGLLFSGLIIVIGGSTNVFVPEDLDFIKLTATELDAINPRLVPLIAHDRAAFGGAMLPTGIVMLGAILYGRPTRSRWQAICLAGTIGYGAAIVVHFYVGYLNWTHLVPAYAAAIVFYLGIAATFKQSLGGNDTQAQNIP